MRLTAVLLLAAGAAALRSPAAPMVSRGRVRALVVHPQDKNVIWAGAAMGGIWKSTDAGVTWRALDDFLPTLTITSLAIDPTNANVLYAGTGEIFTLLNDGMTLRGQHRGAGILKTTDGGTTWSVLTATNGIDYVSRVARRRAPGVRGDRLPDGHRHLRDRALRLRQRRLRGSRDVERLLERHQHAR